MNSHYSVRNHLGASKLEIMFQHKDQTVGH